MTQPDPTGDGPVITPLVIADLEERSARGAQAYGTPLRAFNGRHATLDLYEELLDAVQYGRQVMIEYEQMERENRRLRAAVRYWKRKAMT